MCRKHIYPLFAILQPKQSIKWYVPLLCAGSSPAVDTPDELHPAAAGPARVPGRSRPSQSSEPPASSAPSRAGGPLAGGRCPRTRHTMAKSNESVVVFIGGKARRPLLVCSCAHCGGVVGFDLLWHGAPETSCAGLSDVLTALECILQRLLKASPVPAPATTVEPVVVLYNDAVVMSDYVQQLASSGHQGFSTVQQHVK